jgi:hypothetical protein
VDYLSPQLYWPVESRQQSFPVLLDWWEQQNIKGRGLWPGLEAASVGGALKANDIERQVRVLRETPGVDGEVYFHLRNLIDNPDLNAFVRDANTNAVLIPAMNWLSSSAPSQPYIYVADDSTEALTFNWRSSDIPPKLWLVQYRGTNDVWMAQIYPADQVGCTFSKMRPDLIAVSAVDNYGIISAPAVLRRFVTPERRRPASGKTGVFAY